MTGEFPPNSYTVTKSITLPNFLYERLYLLSQNISVFIFQRFIIHFLVIFLNLYSPSMRNMIPPLLIEIQQIEIQILVETCKSFVNIV